MGQRCSGGGPAGSVHHLLGSAVCAPRQENHYSCQALQASRRRRAFRLSSAVSMGSFGAAAFRVKSACIIVPTMPLQFLTARSVFLRPLATRQLERLAGALLQSDRPLTAQPAEFEQVCCGSPSPALIIPPLRSPGAQRPPRLTSSRVGQ